MAQGKITPKYNIPTVILKCVRDVEITKLVYTERDVCKLEKLFEIIK